MGFVVMEPVHTPPMSGSNAICVATVLLDTGIVPMQEPETRFARIERAADVAGHPAIVPSIQGRAWITETRQPHLDPPNPFPRGYRLGDVWPNRPT